MPLVRFRTLPSTAADCVNTVSTSLDLDQTRKEWNSGRNVGTPEFFETIPLTCSCITPNIRGNPSGGSVRILREAALSLLCVALGSVVLYAQEHEQQRKAQEFLKSINWQVGPSKADLQGHSEVQVPEGFVFAGADDTKRLIEFMQNPPSGNEVGFLAPTSLAWFLTFEFSNVGYVRDDDKDKLDANALLESIKKGTESANEIRRQRGWAELHISGWYQAPKYNPKTNNLEWAIRGVSDNSSVVNFNTRLLGRYGVMEVNLVGDPDEVPKVIPIYSDILNHHTFKSGKSYAEFKPGDKIAEYGLVALVAGTAAVVATKTGFLSKAWGLIVLLVAKCFKLIVVSIATVFDGSQADFDQIKR